MRSARYQRAVQVRAQGRRGRANALTAAALAVGLLGPGLAAASPPDDEAPAPPPRPCTPEDPVACTMSPPTARPGDAYGPRPAHAPRLTRGEILEYALRNTAVDAASYAVDAMRAQLQKAKFAWVPAARTSLVLSPGVSIRCQDVTLQSIDASGVPGDPFEFQHCFSGRDPDLDINTLQGYLRQLGQAGVLVRFNLDVSIPIFTFGKLRGAKRLAELGVAVAELQRLQTTQEIALKVMEAHAALLLARASIEILEQAWGVVAEQRAKIHKELGIGDGFDADPSDVDPLRDPDDQFEIEIGESEIGLRLREARKIEALALASLWALAGKAAPRDFDVAEVNLVADALDGGLRPLPEYQQLARNSRPEAKMAAAGVQVRREQAKLARAAFLPDLGGVISVNVGQASNAEQVPALYYAGGRPNFQRVIIGLGLTWRIDFVGDAFGLQRARAELRRANAQREMADQILALEVEKAYRELEDAVGDMTLIDRAAKASWSLVLSQQAKQSVGGGEFSKLRRHLQQWAEYEFKRQEAIMNHNVAVARLARATGANLVRDLDSAMRAAKEDRPPTQRGTKRKERKERKDGPQPEGSEGPEASPTIHRAAPTPLPASGSTTAPERGASPAPASADGGPP